MYQRVHFSQRDCLNQMIFIMKRLQLLSKIFFGENNSSSIGFWPATFEISFWHVHFGTFHKFEIPKGSMKIQVPSFGTPIIGVLV